MTVKLRGTLRTAAIVLSVVIGVLIIVVVSAVGDCPAFGDRCPTEAKSWWEDDAFGKAAAGGAPAFGVPTFLAKPSKRRLWQALLVAVGAVLVIGLIARDAALR